MNEKAVSDAGPPLHLTEIGCEALLSLWAEVTVSELVRDELARLGVLPRIEAALSAALTAESVGDTEVEFERASLARPHLSDTDLSVAALAQCRRPDVVLTDDLDLRKALDGRGQKVTGSVGVLFRAFQEGRISRDDLRRDMDALLSGSTLYLSRGFRKVVRDLIDRA